MFPTKVLTQLGRYYKLASLMRSMPYKWHQGEKELQVATSRRHKFHFYAIVSWYLLNSCFMGWHLIQSVAEGKEDAGSIILTSSYLTFTLSLSCFFSNTLLHKELMAALLGEIIAFSNDWSHRYGVSRLGCFAGGYCDFFILALTPTSFAVSAGFAYFFMIEPNHPRYIYGLFGHYDGDRPLNFGYFLYFLWEWYTWSCGFMTIYFYWFYLLLYCNFCKLWLDEIMPEKTSPYKTVGVLRELEHSFPLYRRLELMNRFFQVCTRHLLFPVLKAFNVIIHTTSTYTVIKLHTQLQLPMLFSFAAVNVNWFVIEFLTYPMSGSLFEMSRDFLREVQARTSLDRKVWRSFRAISVYVGELYPIGKHTTLTVLSIVSGFTLNLLVMK